MSDDETTEETERIDRGAPSRIGRVLLGVGLAAQASEDFRDMEDTIEYAESAGCRSPTSRPRSHPG